MRDAYRRIDITVGPKIFIARLETRKVCECGADFIQTSVPLKKRYAVDLRSVRWVKFLCHSCGRETPIRLIDVWSELLVPAWFPLGCLDVDLAIPLTPIPDNWMPVKNNLVAPAHGHPYSMLRRGDD